MESAEAVVAAAPQMHIAVKAMDGRAVALSLALDAVVQDVKRLVEAETGIPTYNQCLFVAGTEDFLNVRISFTAAGMMLRPPTHDSLPHHCAGGCSARFSWRYRWRRALHASPAR